MRPHRNAVTGARKQQQTALVRHEVMRMRKRGFTPPWRTWMRAIFDRYVGNLRDGLLVSLGVLTPGAAKGLSHPFDALARPRHMT